MDLKKAKATEGFTPPPKSVAALKFVDGDYAGAKVEVALSASVGLFLALSKGATGAEELDALFRRFGDELLLSWNIDDRNGQRRPSTGEGMTQVDTDFAQAIVAAWLSAKATPPTPLEEPSSDGEKLQAASMTLAPS